MSIEAFCKKWSPSDHEEWMLIVERIEQMYCVAILLKKLLELLFKMMKPWNIYFSPPIEEHNVKTLPTSSWKTKHKKKIFKSMKKHFVHPWKTLIKTLNMRIHIYQIR